MVYTQIGPGTTAASGDPSVSYGAGTTAGALLVAIASIRSEFATVTAITDSGANTWTPISGTPLGQAGYGLQVFAWYCTNAASLTAMEVEFNEAVAGHLTILEFPDGATAAPIDGVNTNIESDTTPYTAVQVTPTEATSTVVGVLAFRSNRTVAQIAPGYTDLASASAGTMYTRAAILENAGTAATGPQWETTGGGSPTTGALLTFAVKMGGSSPDPLSVDVGADRSIYDGQSIEVTATPSGGAGSPTYAWTVSGGTGTFSDDTSATTTFTPDAVGAYALRCTVTDGGDSAFDEMQLTVSPAPSGISTVATVNDATEWDAIGGTHLEVLSDTSNDTYVSTEGGAVAKVIDVTMQEVDPVPGQNVIFVTDARYVSMASGSVSGVVYDSEDNELATFGPVAFTEEWSEVRVSISQSAFQEVVFPHALRIVTSWTGVPL